MCDNIKIETRGRPRTSDRASGEIVKPTKEQIAEYGSYHKAYYQLNKSSYDFLHRRPSSNRRGRPKSSPDRAIPTDNDIATYGSYNKAYWHLNKQFYNKNIAV